MNHIVLSTGNGPRFTYGGAALRDDTAQLHITTHVESHAAFLIHITIEIDLCSLLMVITARKPTENWCRRPGSIPLVKPLLAINLEGISKYKPPVTLSHTGFLTPKTFLIPLLHLSLSEVDASQISPRQVV